MYCYVFYVNRCVPFLTIMYSGKIVFVLLLSYTEKQLKLKKVCNTMKSEKLG